MSLDDALKFQGEPILESVEGEVFLSHCPPLHSWFMLLLLVLKTL